MKMENMLRKIQRLYLALAFGNFGLQFAFLGSDLSAKIVAWKIVADVVLILWSIYHVRNALKMNDGPTLTITIHNRPILSSKKVKIIDAEFEPCVKV